MSYVRPLFKSGMRREEPSTRTGAAHEVTRNFDRAHTAQILPPPPRRKQPAMRFIGRLSLLASVLGGSITGALAQELITVCGASAGYTYFVDRAREQKRWEKDGISRGTTTFMRDASGGYDIVIKDAATTFSAKQD